MAIAGLFLLTFLPIHLYINLLLLKPDPHLFNKAAHIMSTFLLIRIIEVILFLSIIIHSLIGIILKIHNWRSRPIGYSSRNRSETDFFSKFMIWTGLIILLFLILHLSNFFFIRLGIAKGDADDFYSIAHSLFRIPIYDLIYIISISTIGFHLYHAFSSAFQTLGVNHHFWNPVIKSVALIYAIIIPLGFICIPLIIWISG